MQVCKLSKSAFPIFLLVAASQLLSGCNAGLARLTGNSRTVSAVRNYCSTTTAYAGGITVAGNAYYEYRIDGNGEVADGGVKISPTVAGQSTFTVTLDGTAYTLNTAVSPSRKEVTDGLAALINAASSAPVTASSTMILNNYYLILNPKTYEHAQPHVTYTRAVSANLTASYRTPANPIRFAEIEVRDSAGTTIQCGATDNNGAYSLSLPVGTGTYTIYVHSRISNTSKANVYVLDDPWNNLQHSISKSVTATASSSSNMIIASATGTLEGGAFNILDQILKANEFLMTELTNANGCGTTFTDCDPMTTAPPISYVYWKKGVDPAEYFGNDGVSFYTGDSRIFLLGGDGGEVDTADSDHFDNTIIIHEYGHFIEDMYSQSDSPGGSHTLNTYLDPRLAYGEAWANFFQAAVTGDPVYLDTEGNTSSSSFSDLVNEDIETADNDAPPTVDGEGFFKEFSITRLLWDAYDSVNEGGGIDDVGGAGSFAEIWGVFAGDTSGLRASGNYFRHMGTFLKIQDNVAGRTSWATLRSAEKQNGNVAANGVGLRHYATPLTAGACAATSITPVTASFLLSGHDYLMYYHSGGTLTVNLSFSASDLDLYVYRDGYRAPTSLANPSTGTGLIGYSDAVSTTSETVSASASAGYYMIDVVAYGNSTYSLTVNSQAQCLNP